mgnify:CR=1 FL=1
MLQEDKDLLRELVSVLSNWKNDLISPKQAYALAKDAKYQIFAKCYERYAAQIRAYNALDFDDLIMLPTLLFKQNEEVRSKWQEKIRYLLVDEYQDTNTSQYELIKLLVGERACFTVVGDDDQSIYGWRGAQVENIQKFLKDFNAETIRLEQNYRSTGNILKSANQLISNNSDRLGKNLWTDGEMGEPVGIYAAFNELDEAKFVASQIQNWVDDGGKLDDVLFYIVVIANLASLKKP